MCPSSPLFGFHSCLSFIRNSANSFTLLLLLLLLTTVTACLTRTSRDCCCCCLLETTSFLPFLPSWARTPPSASSRIHKPVADLTEIPIPFVSHTSIPWSSKGRDQTRARGPRSETPSPSVRLKSRDSSFYLQSNCSYLSCKKNR